MAWVPVLIIHIYHHRTTIEPPLPLPCLILLLLILRPRFQTLLALLARLLHNHKETWGRRHRFPETPCHVRRGTWAIFSRWYLICKICKACRTCRTSQLPISLQNRWSMLFACNL